MPKLYGWILPCLCFCLPLLLSWSTSDFFYGDEARHAMNGVLIHDYVRDLIQGDLSSRSPMRYAKTFYVRYPALSLGYHPPGFSLILAAMYALLGVRLLTAHLTVLFFAGIGSLFLYRLLKAMGTSVLGFLGALVISASPVVCFWSQGVMLDVPAMACMTASAFYLWLDLEKPSPGTFLLAILWGVAGCYVKQTAGLSLVFIAVMSLRKDRFAQLKTVWFWLGWLGAILALVPLVWLTFSFGMTTLSENVMGDAVQLGWLAAERWSFYIRSATRYLEWPLWVIAGAAFLWHCSQKRSLGLPLWFFLIWMFLVYLGMSSMAWRSVRLGLCLAPPMVGLFLHILHQALSETRLWRPPLMVGLFLCYGIYGMFRPGPQVASFAPVADWVQENWHGDTVLYSGELNGNFIFQMRRLDPRHQRIVLRGSRVLAMARVMPRFGVKTLIASVEELRSLLDRYRTGILVVESSSKLEGTGKELLLAATRDTASFTKVREFSLPALESESGPVVRLSLYRYEHCPESSGPLEIRLESMTSGGSFDLRKEE